MGVSIGLGDILSYHFHVRDSQNRCTCFTGLIPIMTSSGEYCHYLGYMCQETEAEELHDRSGTHLQFSVLFLFLANMPKGHTLLVSSQLVAEIVTNCCLRILNTVLSAALGNIENLLARAVF